MSRAAMQQALAYIEEVDYGPYDKWPVIIALKQALAEPEQPVEYVRDEDNPCYMFTAPTPQPEHKPQTTHWEGCEAVHPECKAAPAPRRPLTNKEISAILDDTLEGGSFFDVALAVARAVERAHGIGEQHE